MTSRIGKFLLTSRARLRDHVQKNLNSFGALLTKPSRWNQLQIQRDRLFGELHKLQERSPEDFIAPLHGIVFSRDRPIQLDALINSYFNLVANPAPLTVLYRTSNKDYRAAYREISAANQDRPVQFREERDFKADLLAALEDAGSQRVFFLVDDDIFIAPFDMNELLGADTADFVPSMRLGLSLDYCYPVNRSQPIPPHKPWKHGLSSWRWSEGKLDWAYPMSVDGNVFSHHEIWLMTKVSEFKGPNSYEEALHSFASLFFMRKGLCYATPRLVNVPVNKVQTESLNYAGSLSADALLNYWQSGYRIDCSKLAGFPNRSAHQEIELPLVMAK